jgi:chromosome segregation ATPase
MFMDLPKDEISVNDLGAKLNSIAEQEKKFRTYESQIKEFDRNILNFNEKKAELQEEIDRMNEAISKIEAELIILNERKKATKAVQPPEDTTEITKKISEASTINAKIRANNVVITAKAEETRLSELYSERGKDIKRLEESKASLLASAPLPIKGISVNAIMQVTYNGVPISDLSTAEKVKIGAAIAVAQNPKATIILVDDVSLLDTDNLSMLHDICKDFQIWQVLNDSTGKEGFFIEEGILQQKEEDLPEFLQ